MGGTGLTVDLFLGGIITILLLILLILKEFASASENPDWRRIGTLLYIPIIPLLFLFFILAAYRVLFVLGVVPEPRGETPETAEPVAAASETITSFEPFAIILGLTQTPDPTTSHSPTAGEALEPAALPTITWTDTPAPTTSPPTEAPVLPSPPPINPSPTFPPPPPNTPPPAPTVTKQPTEPLPTEPQPTEPQPTPEPTAIETQQPTPEPTSIPPGPNPTPTPAPTESGEPPGERPTPTPAPLPE